ncbi:MAG TPA: 30S ribosomal protein S13 [Planctomycetota bacterium]|nr:30S ribosomal protein S13 [Planctomycetota bacterium]
MPRIIGVDVPNDKQTWVSLTYIYGIGPTQSRKICEACGIEPGLKAKNLSEDELSRIGSYIERNNVVEGQLRRQEMQNIGRLKEIRCYRGLRHIRGLPVRGQRTRTNARTRKGKKKTVAGKKSVKEMR